MFSKTLVSLMFVVALATMNPCSARVSSYPGGSPDHPEGSKLPKKVTAHPSSSLVIEPSGAPMADVPNSPESGTNVTETDSQQPKEHEMTSDEEMLGLLYTIQKDIKAILEDLKRNNAILDEHNILLDNIWEVVKRNNAILSEHHSKTHYYNSPLVGAILSFYKFLGIVSMFACAFAVLVFLWPKCMAKICRICCCKFDRKAINRDEEFPDDNLPLAPADGSA